MERSARGARRGASPTPADAEPFSLVLGGPLSDAPPAEPLVGSADISHWPIVATSLPFLPLVLTVIPIGELIQRLVQILL